ncbi:hypothetical protein EGM97_02305 [Pseudomonas sp. AF32]|uniref:hypothetical protein n=1 Tax=Pseudomonas sp. AF32 TaxID=554390 RepID=UPI001EEE9E89|nr:hypothetical protein [Pseudomonas sp. AF32]MCG6573536.1 hypothetical protein [Pseudomonas sp. AF32]
MNTEKSGKLITIRAAIGSDYADLEVECGWTSSGNVFYVDTKRYRARNNGRSKGNIKVKLISKGDTDWMVLNNDDGVQDGKWHVLAKQLTVQGNASSAIIHFNWIYDVQGYTDPNMTGQATVPFP